jgi:DeoR/GlpR family transcriptional regulator of sugar metabolism
MGASGFDAKTGFSCQNLIEAETKRAMCQIAHEVVMLVDGSKFEQTAFAPFCNLKQVDCVISDMVPTKATLEILQKANVEVVLAKPTVEKTEP